MAINGGKVKKVWVIDSKGKHEIKKVWNINGELIFNFADDVTVSVSAHAERQGYNEGHIGVGVVTNLDTAVGITSNDTVKVSLSGYRSMESGSNPIVLTKTSPTGSASVYVNCDYSSGNLNSTFKVTVSFRGKTESNIVISKFFDMDEDNHYYGGNVFKQ